MADFLVIRAGRNGEPSEWVVADSDGGLQGPVTRGSLQQAAEEHPGKNVIGLVPATEVLTTTVTIPARSSTRIRAALPFALEESLAQDIEELHFAAGPRQADGQIPVAVTAHENLGNWLAEYRDAGIEPLRLLPENFGLPKIPGTMSLLVDDTTLMFNDGDSLEFVLQDVKPSDVLVAAGKLGDATGDDDAEAESAGHLQVFCSANAETRLVTEWIALRHELSSVDVATLPDGALPKLAATVAQGHGINLLQGKYGRRPEYATMLKPWKTAAALVLGLLILTVGGKAVDTLRLGQELDALQTQFTDSYRELRPGDTQEIRDPEALLRNLRQSAGGASAPPVFLQSLTALGAAVDSNSDASIEAISYRAGVVDIRLVTPDIPTLDRIQQAVAETGQFNATVQSAEQVGDVVDGRMQIRESGS